MIARTSSSAAWTVVAVHIASSSFCIWRSCGWLLFHASRPPARATDLGRERKRASFILLGSVGRLAGAGEVLDPVARSAEVQKLWAHEDRHCETLGAYRIVRITSKPRNPHGYIWNASVIHARTSPQPSPPDDILKQSRPHDITALVRARPATI